MSDRPAPLDGSGEGAPSLPIAPAGAFDLVNATRRVGWLDHDRIVFIGFATVSEVAGAAWVARSALARRVAKSAGEPPPYFDPTALTLMQDGSNEWISAGEERIARLVRAPVGDGNAGADRWFGFEISAPQPADQLTIRSTAHIIYRGLRRSGVRWRLLDEPTEQSRT